MESWEIVANIIYPTWRVMDEANRKIIKRSCQLIVDKIIDNEEKNR